MELESVRWVRRAAGGAVSLSAIALVMAKVSGSSDAATSAVGGVASLAFCLSLILLVVAWRREHALNEAASAARERQQLAVLRVEAERAKNQSATQLSAARRTGPD